MPSAWHLQRRWNVGLASVAALLLGVVGLWGTAGVASAACPNEEFRTGASAGLPDCRAYELVSPPDANGREISAIRVPPFNTFATELASPFSDSILYMTPGTPLSEPGEASGNYDLYEAVRSPSGGWQTVRHLNPSGAEAAFPEVGGVSSNHLYDFYGVSPVEGGDGGSLAADGTTNYLGKPNGSFEPIGSGSLGVDRRAEGRWISPIGDHVIFASGTCGLPCTPVKLEPEAPESGTAAVYDREPNGQTRVVSLLPDGSTPLPGENAFYQGASADGSTVAFKIAETLYVRIDNTETKLVTAEESTFAGLSADGSMLYYVHAGDIFAFRTATGATDEVNATGDAEVVNVSADGSHLYFTSPSQLDPPQGTSGEANIYAWDEATETVAFVATVLGSDLNSSPGLAKWTSEVVNPVSTESRGPGADSSRTTPDGRFFAFESRAQLTSYPNEGMTEIYRYDAATGSIVCISCNPAGTPATANARFEAVNEEVVKALMAVHNMTDSGSKVFFETTEALTPQDVDNGNDIYEWQEGQEGSEPTVSLISSGKSRQFTIFGFPIVTNILFSVTPDGNDVVFSSRDQLAGDVGDGGVMALYDARVGGGFAEPALSSPCSGEECQQATAPPSLPQSQSGKFRGKGNAKQRKPRCRRSHAHRRGKGCHRRHRKHRHHSGKAKRLAVTGGE